MLKDVESVRIRNSLGFIDSDNPLSVLIMDSEGNIIQSTVSANNSTTTPLGIDGVFTGIGEEIVNYAAINISVHSDQDSVTNGLSLQWSSDNVNWDEKQEHSISANDTFVIQAMGEGRYFRIVYTNGGVAQSTFRLTAIYKIIPSLSEVQHLRDLVTDDSDALLVRAVLTGKKPNNDYANVQLTSGGNTKVSIEEYDDAANPVRKDLEGGGVISVGTTAVEATFTGTTNSVTIQSIGTNTGILYVGKSNVTNAGANALVELEPGDVITIDYNDVDNAVWVVSDTAAQSFIKGATL